MLNFSSSSYFSVGCFPFYLCLLMDSKLSSGKQDTLHVWQIKMERASDEAFVTTWTVCWVSLPSY